MDYGTFDVVVIGGGQAGLAAGYHLRTSGLSYVILDAQPGPGGAWRHGWDSLRLFSPARWSSLPGWLMPDSSAEYPGRDEVLSYLTRYEERYGLPVERPVHVCAVHPDGDLLRVEADRGVWRALAVVSTTGSWSCPYVPRYPGQDAFRGTLLHSAEYRSSEPFAGKRVLVVGGGNSGAQIMAELADRSRATWITLEEPRFLPDHVDGRYLFEQATARYKALQEGRDPDPPASLGDVVMVPPVREARVRGDLESVRRFTRFTETGVIWTDGREERVDAVIWCTGFRPAMDHLEPLGVLEPDGRVDVRGTRSVKEPQLWLVGYGNWTGFASATIIGVGRSAKATVEGIKASTSSDDRVPASQEFRMS